MAHDLTGHHFVVVGGGVSGLSAAWYLQQRGASTHIVERGPELGGRVGSGLLGDRVVTLGGKNIGLSYRRFRALAACHGSHSYEDFGINSSRVINGRLIRFDSNHRMRLLGEARRVSPGDALRMMRLVRQLKRDPETRYLSERACARLSDRWGARTLAELFGEQLCELLLRSLTVRVSAAEPEEVPAANALPYIAMLLDTYEQLVGGMDRVVAAAGRCSRVSLVTEATGLTVERGRVCGVELRTPTGDRRREDCDGVVLATPARATADLLREMVPRAAGLLREVRYFPVLVLLVEYEQPVFSSDVRAMVFGGDQALSNAGAYGSNDLNVVRYTFSGRRARTLLIDEPDLEVLARIGEESLAGLANVDRCGRNRRVAMIARRFAPGLCAYHLDQPRLLANLRSAMESLGGLALSGDYLRGGSIEACCMAAEEAALQFVS